MDNDDEFITRWKPIHEKTIINYVVLESSIYFVCMVIVILIILWIYPSNSLMIGQNGLYFVIALNVLSFLIFIVLRLLSWFSGEKRYKELIKENLLR